MTVEVKVPDIGDFTDVPVVTVLVSVGDTIAEEDPIVELESDKATMEVPSPAAGKITEIKDEDEVKEKKTKKIKKEKQICPSYSSEDTSLLSPMGKAISPQLSPS